MASLLHLSPVTRESRGAGIEYAAREVQYDSIRSDDGERVSGAFQQEDSRTGARVGSPPVLLQLNHYSGACTLQRSIRASGNNVARRMNVSSYRQVKRDEFVSLAKLVTKRLDRILN